MFREGEWPSTGELELRKVVTICDHLRLLVMGQLKAEVRWESVGIALYRLIQGFVWYAIKRGKIRINNHLLCPNGQDERFDWLARLHSQFTSGRHLTTNEQQMNTKESRNGE